VAVSLLHHDALSERPLVGEPQAFRGAPRGLVVAVALPLVAAVAVLLERAPHHEVHRFSRRGRVLEYRRELEVSYLDNAVRRLDAEVGSDADCLAGGGVDDGIELRVALTGPLGDLSVVR